MAGDWIKVENVTPDKPEVFSIAEVLTLDSDAVVGKLVRIWIWADTQTYNGNAGSVTLALLDRVSGVTGFGKAMIEAGWLTEEDHGLTFPNFDRHNGKSAKTRAQTARRVREHRVTKVKRKRNAPSVTPSSLLFSSLLGKEGIVPPDFKTHAEFPATWDRWVTHRKEIKADLTPTMVTAQMKKFGKAGVDAAIAMIDQSIENGWRGLFEPKNNGHAEPADEPPIRITDDQGRLL